MNQTIHTAGNYTVEKLAAKHYVVYYEDDYAIIQIASFKNELSAVKKAEELNA